jgi:hypothetical protein
MGPDNQTWCGDIYQAFHHWHRVNWIAAAAPLGASDYQESNRLNQARYSLNQSINSIGWVITDRVE